MKKTSFTPYDKMDIKRQFLFILQNKLIHKLNHLRKLKFFIKGVSIKSNPFCSTGFTLLEIILYIGLLSIIILPVSALFSMVLQLRTESQLNNEIEQQGLQVAQIIAQTIRNAKGINSPTIGASSSTLSLNVSDVSKNPTIFELSGNAIKIKEGAGSAIALTSSAVAPANLVFQNLSRSGTPGTIRVSFQLNSKTFYASASVR